jgi:hypothetical protein
VLPLPLLSAVCCLLAFVTLSHHQQGYDHSRGPAILNVQLSGSNFGALALAG